MEIIRTRRSHPARKSRSTLRSNPYGGYTGRLTHGRNGIPTSRRRSLPDRIAVGTVFRWETAVMEIPSTIGVVVPLKKLAWSGETGSVLGIHVWTFTATTEGTHVRTEESWEGP